MYESFNQERWAFYWVPSPDSAEHRLLTPLIGRDILTGESVPQIAPDGIDAAAWAKLTETPAHYGVHATLKAPFEPKPGVTADDLKAAGRKLASHFGVFQTRPLTLRYIPAGGGFFALTPEETDAPLQALERACVSEPDSLRAPISDADIARRGELPGAQARYLRTWGYHLVFQFFRFHITISGALPDPAERATVEKGLAAYLAPLIGRPLQMEAVGLCRQASRKDPFVLVERFPFGNN